MAKSSAPQDQSASKRISERIAELADWRGETLARMRKLIRETNPDIFEEWKWMGTPIWSLDGIICTGESYKSVVKLTFAKGAFLSDPTRLFNSSLEGNMRRAIDIHQGERVDASAFKALVRAAIALNSAKAGGAPKGAAKKKLPAKKEGRSAPAKTTGARAPTRARAAAAGPALAPPGARASAKAKPGKKLRSKPSAGRATASKRSAKSKMPKKVQS